MLPSPRRARGPPAAARRRIPAMDQPPSAAAYDAEAADQPLTAAQALLLHWEAAWSQRAPGRGVPSALLRAAGGARGLALLSLLFSLLSTALALAAPMLLRARLASGGAHLGVAVALASFGAHAVQRFARTLAGGAGARWRAMLLQGVVRRTLLAGGGRGPSEAGVHASLTLLFADCEAAERDAADAILALCAPLLAAAAACLLFHILGPSGLVGASVALSLSPLLAAFPVCPGPGLPLRLAALAALAPCAAAASLALFTRNRRLLSAADAFSTLWLVDLLRATGATGPSAAAALARCRCAAMRLTLALSPVPRAAAPAPPPAELRQLISRRPGSLVLLAGPAGSGKSSACLAAVQAARGNGAAAFAGAEPFLVPTLTLRDNVLFCQPFDAVWYAAVCEALCLPQLVFHPRRAHGGDLSLPLDGQPLSLGQAQLLSVARCAYARPAVVGLDVRIGRLGPPDDAAESVQAIILRALLGGPLASATRVLVADGGATHLLAEAHAAVLLGPGGRVAAFAEAQASAEGEAKCGRIMPLPPALLRSLLREGGGPPEGEARARPAAALRRAASWPPEAVCSEEASCPASPAASSAASEDSPATPRVSIARLLPSLALLAVAMACVLGAPWWLSRALDRASAHPPSIGTALQLLAAASLVGLLPLAAALSLLPAWRHDLRAAALVTGLAAAALLAALSRATLAASVPSLAVSLALAVKADVPQPPGFGSGLGPEGLFAASSLALTSLCRALGCRGAPQTVAVHGCAARVGGQVAHAVALRLRSGGALRRRRAAAGALVDAAGGATLAAALFAAKSGGNEGFGAALALAVAAACRGVVG